jgi:hypothetical protein
VVITAQYAHNTQIKRCVPVGFATAGVLLELIEGAGVIGPFVGGRRERDVLVPR